MRMAAEGQGGTGWWEERDGTFGACDGNRWVNRSSQSPVKVADRTLGREKELSRAIQRGDVDGQTRSAHSARKSRLLLWQGLASSLSTQQVRTARRAV